MPITIALTVVGAFWFVSAACSSPAGEEFAGTTLRTVSDSSAFDFALRDQFGRLTSLKDHKGNVVVLTFMFTNCPDTCPILTNQLHNIYEQLTEQGKADKVSVLIISVDPERDTVYEVWRYLDRWGFVNDWKFLVGSRNELVSIWDAYHLKPRHIHDRSTKAHSHDKRDLSGGHNDTTGSLSKDDSYLVVHSAPVYLIDQQGRKRVVFTTPLESRDVIHDIRLLLAQ
ncbi:SCO family protein [Dehalococcoidia bacterium]|nr:SCO family protein [Dehalococcoidia bacterium]